jgi:hypothetical protein
LLLSSTLLFQSASVAGSTLINASTAASRDVGRYSSFMQKTFISLSFLLIGLLTVGQNSINLTLKFKGQAQTVYKVTMNSDNIDSFNIDFPRMGDTTNDSFNKMNKQANDAMKSMLRMQNSIDKYFVIKEVSNNKYFLACTDTFPIRNIRPGSRNYSTFIDNKGNNLTFYLPNGLKTLTHIFFGLPQGKVKVGDTWKLGVDMTEMDNNAICDSSFKKDNVSVTDISLKNGDTLVTIDYDFEEYFQGVFITQIISDLKYYGKAVFSVNRGLGVSYECKKEATMTGIGNTKSKETYKLELVTEYPKKILEKIPK